MSIEAFALRLAPDQDLKLEIARFAREKGLQAACVLAAVGSLKLAHLRFAGRDAATGLAGDFEILSLSGTIAKNGQAHLHMSVADKDGRCFGGHVVDGCLVRTTAEIVLGELKGYVFDREVDAATSFYELAIAPRT